MSRLFEQAGSMSFQCPATSGSLTGKHRLNLRPDLNGDGHGRPLPLNRNAYDADFFLTLTRCGPAPVPLSAISSASVPSACVEQLRQVGPFDGAALVDRSPAPVIGAGVGGRYR